jgi:RHS repeat-associated protein
MARLRHLLDRSQRAGGPAGGTLEWLNADRNNTVTDELNRLTLATTSRHFDPFGNAVGTTPNWTSGHSYLNADTNQQANTVELGARQYDPTLGRFLSPDPILNPASPQQANGYSYSGNNPVTESDPTGACPRDICGEDGPAGNMSVGYQGDAGDTLGQERKAFVAAYTSAKKKMQQKLSAYLGAKYMNPATAPGHVRPAADVDQVHGQVLRGRRRLLRRARG